MPSHRIDDDSVNCEELQRALRGERELTAQEAGHLEACDACLDVRLTRALDAKPEVAIPADFAARVAAGVPARSEERVSARVPRPWGLATAMAVVTVLLMVSFAGQQPANNWAGTVFLFLVASEIAGLALWLGPRWMRR